MRVRVLACVIGFAISFAPLSAHVTLPIEFREIVGSATLIVRGRVTDSRTLAAREWGVESTAAVAVERIIKGTAGEFVSVVVPGGSVGRYSWKMIGAPSLRTGERAVLFLKRDSGNLWRPVGLSQGVYPIAASATRADYVDPPLVLSQNVDSGRVVRGDARRRLMGVAEFESLVLMVMSSQSTSAAVTDKAVR
jgi:hypothetical protein